MINQHGNSYEVNGHVFNSIGELIEEPNDASVEDLKLTLNELYKHGLYIAASRIQHRINVHE